MPDPEYTKNELLLQRIARLYHSVKSLNGQCGFIVERQIYHLLETNHSPLRALGRYAWYIVIRFWGHKVEDFHWYRRWYWYRWVRRWPAEKTFSFIDADSAEFDRELRALIEEERLRQVNSGEAE